MYARPRGRLALRTSATRATSMRLLSAYLPYLPSRARSSNSQRRCHTSIIHFLHQESHVLARRGAVAACFWAHVPLDGDVLRTEAADSSACYHPPGSRVNSRMLTTHTHTSFSGASHGQPALRRAAPGPLRAAGACGITMRC